ncbi:MULTISPECIES: tRNA (adenosine(37)-N6)-threonylcarbamoyltransferase complex ATPase subunit type 1 TsaE [Sphingobacterium]|uniref:tRNA threonylcarbamoyladenosine biosynthesis protein TsaE n=1 Tax=Sphingobacterium cellulitidis TaxID=1768011 RepID=A0A8H9G2K9_9SPHI|nr:MULTISPECIES: tRNA (adenosine(37)-N6)-threonylcarbamoyltransferase complex ATPase subunit type 1 TsaE [Sphingobacterium]MBA8987368.1 tRNA threonylcarbamoyladenosine biosynthesis protein TsaE [Sphingobacterium soli]OYD46337.1 tRNA (adenosine(37)-N6)-threonylcarbamoyltransferase complex ATPase subunit type 1 TsaE [Sphingobacterium cellulitidis]WFB63094.1 tRNA (adenosine(37)-N6)-threonylcarbamoyltransferase complex ATPase subunit type 1 TsaE [Sphingobacterium sp. WM]GGE25358.1 tRNA (adenosine(3
MEFKVANPEGLADAAKWLIDQAGNKRVFVFQAPMGAGKTTFIKAICEHLQVEDSTSSPTFSIVNEYRSEHGPIYHFDFYRLKQEQEAFDLGYEEYFYSGDYCFIEWPEKIPNLIPEDAALVKIEVSDDQSRTIILK